jgi:hypothetical protein
MDTLLLLLVLAKTGKICTVIAPTNWHWEEADPPPLVPGLVSAVLRPRP